MTGHCNQHCQSAYQYTNSRVGFIALRSYSIQYSELSYGWRRSSFYRMNINFKNAHTTTILPFHSVILWL